jgi:CheY-like chemotaxis protein
MDTRKTIFYLDDDRDDLYFFKNAAGSLGHIVSVFHDAHQMLYMLSRAVEKPDLIFLDIHMPVLNGDEILNILKKSEEYRHIPVIMISGAHPKKLIRHLTNCGADHIMKKPGSDLKGALQKVISMDFKREEVSA